MLLPGPHSNRYGTDNCCADQSRAFRIGVGIVLLRRAALGIVSLRWYRLWLITLRRNSLRLITLRTRRSAAVGIPLAHVVIDTTDGWEIRFRQLDRLIVNVGASRMVGDFGRNISEGRRAPHGRKYQSRQRREPNRAQTLSTANFLICPQEKNIHS